MDLSRVWFEARSYGATISVVGFLAEPAATRTCEMIDAIPSTACVVCHDLRAVEFIDPKAFVVVARALNAGEIGIEAV